MRFLGILATAVLFIGIAAAREVKTEIKVSGMTCGACAVSVKAALSRTRGVRSADVDSVRGIATVVYDDTQVSEQQLVNAIKSTGFKAEPGKGKN